MKKIIKGILLGSSMILLCSAVFAERTQDAGLLGQYRQIQDKSQLFDFLQHYYYKSPETAKAMKSSMDSHQLEQINQQLQLMNKTLNALLALEKQRAGLTAHSKG